MRSLRSGVQVQLGMLTFPVGIAKAVDDAPGFSLLCAGGHDPVRVRQSLVCPDCGSDARDGFVKGVRAGDGWAVADADDAVADPGPLKHTLSLSAHPAEEVATATLCGGGVYWLVPEAAARRQYALLAALVEGHPDVALVAVFALRDRPGLYRLGVFGRALSLTRLAWPAAVRAAPDAAEPVDTDMLSLATELLGRLCAPFDPDRYRDERAERLATLAASAGAAAPADAQPTPVTSLLDQLAAALEEVS